MRKYRGVIKKKITIRKPPKMEESVNDKEQMNSFEMEYEKFITELKAKKNEKTTQEENPKLLQPNG